MSNWSKMKKIFSLLLSSSLCFGVMYWGNANTANAYVNSIDKTVCDGNAFNDLEGFNLLQSQPDSAHKSTATVVVAPESLLASKNYLVAHKLASQSYLTALDNLLKDIGYQPGMEQAKVVNTAIYDTFVNEYIFIVSKMTEEQLEAYSIALGLK